MCWHPEGLARESASDSDAMFRTHSYVEAPGKARLVRIAMRPVNRGGRSRRISVTRGCRRGRPTPAATWISRTNAFGETAERKKQIAHGRHFQDNDTRSGTPSVYHRATMQTARPNFERWDFMEPVRRPSVLDPLMPRGLGTPLVESLASYVTRLAEAHVVSVWRLILHVLRPPHASRIPRSSIRYAYPVNGLGKVSEPFLRAFEIATQRADLQLMTLSVLDGCISQPGTFRTTEAWCQCCLEQWRAAELPLYSPLLWTLQAVTMCPIHKCPLADRCPHCQSRFAPLRAKALPGQCSICSKPLGA